MYFSRETDTIYTICSRADINIYSWWNAFYDTPWHGSSCVRICWVCSLVVAHDSLIQDAHITHGSSSY